VRAHADIHCRHSSYTDPLLSNLHVLFPQPSLPNTQNTSPKTTPCPSSAMTAVEHGILPVRDFCQNVAHSLSSLSFCSRQTWRRFRYLDFWSNFEIGSLDFYRSEAYTAYFDHLDKAGGFFYERWGDAPVHSIAACLFLKPEEM
jgi:hypothetical protein